MSVLYDPSIFITRSISQVQATAIEGGLIAVLVLLFLRSILSTIVIAVSIPIAIIATFILFSIPVVYSLMEDVRRRLQGFWGKKTLVEENGHAGG